MALAMLAATTATTNPILLSFSLLLVFLNNNFHHVVTSAFSPFASMHLTARCIGDHVLRCRMTAGRSQSCSRSPMMSSCSPSAVLQRSLSSSSLLSTKNYESISDNATDRNEMKSLGEKLIVRAAKQCGATEPMICIEWNADRIVVTVDVTKDGDYVEDDDWVNDGGDDDGGDDIFMDGYADGGIMLDLFEEEAEFMSDEVESNADDDIDDPQDELDDDDYESTIESESNNHRIDLSRIARTINELLAQDGEDSLSYTIAKLHEIEVTTPEFDNVLKGRRMFESYKGFDVTVEYWEEEKKKKKVKKVMSKSQKDSTSNDDDDDGGGEIDNITDKLELKIVEGKLVSRDYEKEITLINVKGRVAKIRNDMIVRVSLPKAKREKGVK